MKLKILFVVCLLPVFLFAKPVTRNSLSISALHPQAVDRLHCPSCSGVTRVYVNSGAWGDTDCRADAADLYKEDDHLLSILLFAWASGKQISIEVNNNERPIDTVCKITALNIKD
jgi:hypothetical protein